MCIGNVVFKKKIPYSQFVYRDTYLNIEIPIVLSCSTWVEVNKVKTHTYTHSEREIEHTLTYRERHVQRYIQREIHTQRESSRDTEL